MKVRSLLDIEGLNLLKAYCELYVTANVPFDEIAVYQDKYLLEDQSRT